MLQLDEFGSLPKFFAFFAVPWLALSEVDAAGHIWQLWP
jgi:hypothetical protein